MIPQFGNLFLTIAAFVVALSIIVAIHEYGHYIVGRLSGIHAEVFSIGFGRPLFSRTDRHGTRWQVAMIPLGGYVKFLGDANATSAEADEETLARLSAEERRHTMHGAPLWARAATVIAGPLFNFLLSILIFSGFYLVSGVARDEPVIGELVTLPGGTYDLRPGDVILAVDGRPAPDWDRMMEVVDALPPKAPVDYQVTRDGAEMTVSGPALYPPRVAGVSPDSAALSAGIAEGDVVLAIEGVPVTAFTEIKDRVAAGAGKPLTMELWREGKTFPVTLTPKITDLPKADGGFETRYLIGLQGGFFFTPEVRPAGLGEAVKGAFDQTWFVARSSVSALGHILTGAISTCNLRGPISIAETSGQAASQGAADFIWFIAVLSTAVGLMNLFPVPMLDGGHLVFYTWEWATGRPLPDKVMNFAVSIGLFIVLGLMVFGLTNDLFCP
jgi:regulator of sigma E protease